MSRRAEILEVAERILESEGPEALTMRRLASELDIQAPSLYKHLSGKDDIQAGLQQRALERFGAALAEAPPTLVGLGQAYRAWALAHPRLYEVATRQPLRRDEIEGGVEAAAAAPLMAVVGMDVNRARAVWAVAHGLVDLELAGRFPPDADLDAAWDVALRAFAE